GPVRAHQRVDLAGANHQVDTLDDLDVGLFGDADLEVAELEDRIAHRLRFVSLPLTAGATSAALPASRAICSTLRTRYSQFAAPSATVATWSTGASTSSSMIRRSAAHATCVSPAVE